MLNSGELAKGKDAPRGKWNKKIVSDFIFIYMSSMPRVTIADTLTIKQKEYKNAELVLCEFMALQEYDIEEGSPPKYKDFNLQEFHDFIADKIEALDIYVNRYQGTRGKYKGQ